MNTIKKYMHNRIYASFFYSNIIEIFGTSLFNIALVIYAGTVPQHNQRGWAIMMVSIASFVPNLIQILTGYAADKNHQPIVTSRVLKLIQGFLYLGLTFLFNCPFTWILFTILILVNVASDLMGNYASSVLTPFMKVLIDDKERQRMTGFASGIMRTSLLVAQLIGSTALIALSYNYARFSLLNSIIFFLSAAIMFLGIGKKSNYQPLVKKMVHKMKVNNKDADSGNFFHNFIHAIKNIFSVPMLGWYMSLYIFSGLVLAAISEVATLAFLKYPSMRFVNFGFSISTLNIIATIGTILGSAIPFPYFEKKSVATLFFLEVTGIFMVTIALLFQQSFYLTRIFLFMGSKTMPKLNAWIMNNGINEHLAFSLSIIGTAMTVTMPLGQVIFMTVANIWTVKISLSIMGIYMILILVYTKYIKQKEVQNIAPTLQEED
jgi:MFS transporter, DHA3 family, macrolide efflux protein